MSVLGTSRWHVGHQRFCWMRVWHWPWSWLKLIVALASVAGNTLTGMFTRLIFKYPFQVGRAAISAILPVLVRVLDRRDVLVDADLELAEIRVGRRSFDACAVQLVLVAFVHLDGHGQIDARDGAVGHV